MWSPACVRTPRQPGRPCLRSGCHGMGHRPRLSRGDTCSCRRRRYHCRLLCHPGPVVRAGAEKSTSGGVLAGAGAGTSRSSRCADSKPGAELGSGVGTSPMMVLDVSPMTWGLPAAPSGRQPLPLHPRTLTLLARAELAGVAMAVSRTFPTGAASLPRINPRQTQPGRTAPEYGIEKTPVITTPVPGFAACTIRPPPM